MKKKLPVLYIATLLVVMLSYRAKSQQYETSFEVRSAILVNGIANIFTNNPPGTFDGVCGGSAVPDFGKYNYPKMISKFLTVGLLDDSSNARLRRYCTCPTYHFNMVGVPRLFYQFGDAPALKDTNVVINYLNNVFYRTDSYNGFTGEGTENQINMSRTSSYLYCQYAIDHFPGKYPQAVALRDSMKTWILYYSKTTLAMGIGEWNSSTYGVYNIQGWLNLYDFAEDAAIRDAARAVLDYFATELALHYTQGLTGGAEMRKPNTAALSVDTDILSWLWFGDSPMNPANINFTANYVLTAIHAAVSSYRPSDLVVQLAKKQLAVKAMYYNSKPTYLKDTASYIKQTFFIDNGYTLGAAYIPYGGWGSGDYQMCQWKLVGRTDSSNKGNVQYVSGQGLTNYNGTYRAPFDQVVHHKNVLIQLTQVPTNAAAIETAIQNIFTTWNTTWQTDFLTRFPGDPKPTSPGNPVVFQNPNVTTNVTNLSIIPNGGTYKDTVVGNILYVQLNKVYLAIRFLKTNAAVPTASGSAYQIKDNAAPGSLCGFVVEVANVSDYASFAAFRTAIATGSSLNLSQLSSDSITYTNLSGDVIGVKYNVNGVFSEPIYDWGYGANKLGGYVIPKSPPFIQPTWPSGAGHGKLASWTINNVPVNLKSAWPVYSGTNLLQNNGISSVTNSSCTYKTDFSGSAPNFGNTGCTARTLQSITKNLPDSILNGTGFSLGSTASSGLAVGYRVVSGSATLSGNTLTPTSTGYITVEVSQYGNGTYFPATLTYKLIKSVPQIPTGIQPAKTASAAVEVYPNPASQVLNIITNQSDAHTTATLFTLDGRPVNSVVLSGNTTQMNVSGVTPGIYLLNVKGAFSKILRVAIY